MPPKKKYTPIEKRSRKQFTEEVTARALEFMRYVITHRDVFGINSRKHFAETINMSQPALYNVESSPEKNFTIEQLVEMCKVYGVSASWLLLGEGEMMEKDPDLKRTLRSIDLNLKRIKDRM